MALTGGNIGFTGYQQPNYASAVEAAGLPMQAIGQGIAQAQDYFKQQGEKKKLIKKSDVQIDAALKLFPDLAPTLQGVRDQIKDENISLDERAGIAESVAGLINMGTNQMQAMADYGLKKRQLDIQEGQIKSEASIQEARARAEANKRGPITDINVPGGVMQMRENPQTGVLEPIQVAGVSQGVGLVDLVKGFEGFNPNAYSDYKQTSVGYGTKGKEGEFLTEAQATDRLNAELSGHAKRIEEAAKLKGVQLNENQFNALTSFDFNTGKGADLIERFGDKPEELVSKMQEYTKAGGKELPGLVKRRGVEAALFLTPAEDAVGFKPSEQPKGEIVTQEEANRRTASGLSVTATPIGGGRVRITSQTGSPKPSPVIESPESKLQTQRLLELDKSLGSLREAGTTASLDVEPLREIAKLLDTNVKTGFGRETFMQAQKILGQDVSSEEEFQARVGAEAMKNIALTKGAISDREMDYFKTVLSPNMGKTTEGNKKIIEFRIKYANRANRIAKTISDLQKNKKDPYEIQEAVDKIISSESLLDNPSPKKTEANQAAEDAKFLEGF